MILAIDVFYKEDCTARVSGILFEFIDNHVARNEGQG